MKMIVDVEGGWIDGARVSDVWGRMGALGWQVDEKWAQKIDVREEPSELERASLYRQ